jgi:TolA-binding protein
LDNLPIESSIPTANYLQGYNLIRQNKYTEAQGYFTDCVNYIKKNSGFIKNEVVRKQILGDAVLRAGDCYFKKNDYPNAIKFYDEAVNRKYSGFVYAIYQKGVITGLRGDGVNKIITLSEIPEKYPDSEFADDALFEMGLVQQELNKNKEAIESYKKILTNYKKSVLYNRSLIQLGLISFNLGDLNTAIRYYKDVFKNNPDSKEAKDALNGLEEIYVENLGKPDEYTNFLESIPGYKVGNEQKDSIAYKAAISQYQNGNYSKAIEGFNNYLKNYPSGFNALNSLYYKADSYLALKDFSNALISFEEVIEKGNSKFYEISLEKGSQIAYNHSKDYRKAFQLYQKWEQIATKEEKVFMAQLGSMRSAYRMNDLNAAYEISTKVVDNAKATKEIKSEAYFIQGKISYDRKNYLEAKRAFENVISNSDNETTAEARYYICNILYLQGDLKEAEKICNEYGQANQNYPFWTAKIVLVLSDVYIAQKEYFSARSTLEALMENFSDDQEITQEAKKKLAELDLLENKSSKLAPTTNPNLIEFEKSDN